MDPTPFTNQLAPPPFSSSSSTSSPPSASNFRISIAVAVGFAATSIVLIAYYVVVVKFWLNGRQPNRRNHAPPPIFFTEGGERQGVEPSIIRSIPIVKFANVEEYDVDKEKRSSHECAICLIEFRKGESLKLLPSCHHTFHIDCIDTWLENNGNCPMCRTSITSPCNTPLVDTNNNNNNNNNNNHVGCNNTIQYSSQTLEMIISGDQTVIEEREYIEGRGQGQTLGGEQQHISRRSFSMDFFHGRKLTSQASDSNNNNGSGGGGGDGGSGRFRRLFHSFALGRSSRSAVLPIQIDE